MVEKTAQIHKLKYKNKHTEYFVKLAAEAQEKESISFVLYHPFFISMYNDVFSLIISQIMEMKKKTFEDKLKMTVDTCVAKGIDLTKVRKEFIRTVFLPDSMKIV